MGGVLQAVLFPQLSVITLYLLQLLLVLLAQLYLVLADEAQIGPVERVRRKRVSLVQHLVRQVMPKIHVILPVETHTLVPYTIDAANLLSDVLLARVHADRLSFEFREECSGGAVDIAVDDILGVRGRPQEAFPFGAEVQLREIVVFHIVDKDYVSHGVYFCR